MRMKTGLTGPERHDNGDILHVELLGCVLSCLALMLEELRSTMNQSHKSTTSVNPKIKRQDERMHSHVMTGSSLISCDVPLIHDGPLLLDHIP